MSHWLRSPHSPSSPQPWFLINAAQRVSVVVDWSSVSAAFNATFLRVSVMTQEYSVDISWVPPYEAGYPNLARLIPDFLGVIQVRGGRRSVGPARVTLRTATV